MFTHPVIQSALITLVAALLGAWGGVAFGLRAQRIQRASERRLQWAEDLLEYLGQEWAVAVEYYLSQDLELDLVVKRLKAVQIELRDRRLAAGFALSNYAIQRVSWSASHAMFKTKSSLEGAMGAPKYDTPQAALEDLTKELARRRDELVRAIRHEMHEGFYLDVWAQNVYGRSRALRVLGSGYSRLSEYRSASSYNRNLRKQIQRLRSGLPIE